MLRLIVVQGDGGGVGGSFSNKIKVRNMPLRLSENVPEQAVFHQIKVCSNVCILKIVMRRCIKNSSSMISNYYSDISFVTFILSSAKD